MKNFQALSLALTLSVVAVIAAPMAAFAGPEHSAPTETGVVYHPNEAGPGKTSAQVAAELADAKSKPQWASMLRWGVMGTPAVGAVKSREEVSAELQAAQKQPGWDAASRLGVPLATPTAKLETARAARP
jgi:hypothetical protein